MSNISSQSLSSVLTVISASIEGLSAVKSAMLPDMCKEQHCHCLCLQETYRGARKARPIIPGMTLITERPQDTYGNNIFIRDDLKVKSISATAVNHVEVITAELPDVVVHSVYKPPSEQFVLPPLGNRNLPQIVIGDFNSHNTIWGYDDTYNNGVSVVQRAESNSLTLIHDAKLPKSVNSARYKKGYNLDLIFASSSIDNMGVKSVLNPIPSTQHRPICVTVIVSRLTTFRRRFNLRKENWSGYTTDVDILIDEVDPTPENYDRFVEDIRVTSRRCRRHYIPGLFEESKSLYEAYKKQYMSNPFDSPTLDTGNELISKMVVENKRRWENMITSTDLTGNSRKAWQPIRKITNDPIAQKPPCLVTANQIAHQLLVNGRGEMPTKPKCPKLSPVSGDDSSLVFLFTEEEYKKGIATLKNKKAAGIDDGLVEQLKNLGPRAHRWLYSMLNVCFTENRIPKVCRQSKIIAILKPGKDSAIPKSYRPISLLFHMYKLYERLILNRIAPSVDRHLIKEQASFTPGKS